MHALRSQSKPEIRLVMKDCQCELDAKKKRSARLLFCVLSGHSFTGTTALSALFVIHPCIRVRGAVLRIFANHASTTDSWHSVCQVLSARDFYRN